MFGQGRLLEGQGRLVGEKPRLTIYRVQALLPAE